MPNSQKTLLIQSAVIVFGILFFIPFLGNVHLFDWDEINFAESAREMIESGDYLTVQINFQPFWEKPPLFIWLQVLSMKLFGINEFAARFPNAVCGIITLIILFNIGRILHDFKFGLLWILSYAGSILPFFYFKFGIIDPWFNLFIFLGVYFLIIFNQNQNYKQRLLYIVFSACSFGLGILTKGPVAFLIGFLTWLVYFISKKGKFKLKTSELTAFVLTLLVIGGSWFLILIINGNFHIIVDFIEYQIRLFSTKGAKHGGFFLYHFVILFFGVFPASIFAINAFKGTPYDNPEQADFKKWMIYLFWVVLILFTIVKTKIVHYSSLCYFPLTFLCAHQLYHFLENRTNIRRWNVIALICLATVYGIGIIAISYVDTYKAIFIESGLIKNAFVLGNLKAEGQWTGFEWVIGIFLMAGIITGARCLTRKPKMGIILIFSTAIIFTFSAYIFVAPCIERYSQNAAIEFYKNLASKACYVMTLGYKSYAHIYYSKFKPQSHKKYLAKDWLAKGDIDKPAYFSMKIHKSEKYFKLYPELELLYKKKRLFLLKKRPLIRKKILKKLDGKIIFTGVRTFYC